MTQIVDRFDLFLLDLADRVDTLADDHQKAGVRAWRDKELFTVDYHRGARDASTLIAGLLRESVVECRELEAAS